MTGIDWGIVAFTVALAVYGYSQGFIVGALSLVGFAIGAYLGTRLAPLLLSQGSRSPYAPLFGLFGALIGGGLLARLAERIAAGVRRAVPLPGLKVVDGLLGAALTACIALGMVWIVGAVALQAATSQSLRNDLQRSAVLSALNGLLPPSGAILDALARLDPLPSVNGPVADVPAPTRGILGRRGVRRAAHSLVRVTGTACGLGIEGSGWMAGGDLVVTNAHVVAGEHDTTVQAGGVGVGRSAAVIAFDVHDDVAILRVPGLGLPALPFAADARAGAAGAILGFPLDGALRAEPGRLGRTSTISTQNAYGVGHVERALTALRGRVRPGNSGGPIVDAAGRVLATVFAAVTDGRHPGGFAVPNAIVRRELARARTAATPAGTGHCGG